MVSLFEQRYANLNPAQRKAVDTIEGPVLVIAGPGSGKTELLSLRVANILKNTDTPPNAILCLTFTDSAARAMRERLTGLIGNSASRVVIRTFHSLCVEIIERYPESFYGGARLFPADEILSREILQSIFKSLPKDNILRKEHPEQGFVYLSDVLSAISYLKKAGITVEEFERILDLNEQAFKKVNRILSIIPQKLSKINVKILSSALKSLTLKSKHISSLFSSYEEVFSDSLAVVLKNPQETSPFSQWKKEWIGRDESGKRVFKDTLSLPRLRELLVLYRRYTKAMYERGYFDFDDMILEVLGALQTNQNMRAELVESYHYVLVDEFQDTNESQMKLLLAILSSSVHEGRPNVLAVGDDDQAVFKFQGAQTGNFLHFLRAFRNPEVITLAHNYRSTSDILSLSRSVIKNSTEGLERVLSSINKTPTSALKQKGKIFSFTAQDPGEEYTFAAREIEKLSKGGTPLSDIAVIARKHSFLEKFAPFLYAREISVNYERQQNVLEEPHIKELITLVRFLSSLGRKDRTEADELLPQILSSPYWGIARGGIWKLSLQAYKERKPWLECMLHSSESRIVAIASFLIDMSIRSRNLPLEYILDELIGSHIPTLSSVSVTAPAKKKTFVSPFKEYYFSKNNFRHTRAQYLVFLSGLRTFVDAIKRHKKNEHTIVDDLVSFVDLHHKNKLTITDTSAFVSSKDAVRLLTAHSAKGLEFGNIFLLHCHEDAWSGRGVVSKIRFPKNLPIAPSGDTEDDHIRLFYVSITRAKYRLYLLSHERTEAGRETSRLPYLPTEFSALSKVQKEIPLTPPSRLYYPPFVKDEKALLLPLLEDYQMSVTHLNNFLNVAKGGPALFLEQNLLRFPQGKTTSNSFGSAMHKALDILYRALKKEGRLPTLASLLSWFGVALEDERLSKNDFSLERERGRKALSGFYKKKKSSFHKDDLVEVNFAHEGVFEGDVPLGGKIDKMVKVSPGYIRVHDFKTGKVYRDWKGKSEYEKIRLREYERQLTFYKILIEGSSCFASFKVHTGVLEFLEPSKGTYVELSLEIKEEDAIRTATLIKAVYQKITNLDFPDVSYYSPNIAGITTFEDDLIKEYLSSEKKKNSKAQRLK